MGVLIVVDELRVVRNVPTIGNLQCRNAVFDALSSAFSKQSHLKIERRIVDCSWAGANGTSELIPSRL